MTDPAVFRLWQLISPTLPVGAYAYSQGQEFAVNAGWVHDENSAMKWISGVTQNSIATLDLPLLQRFHAAWSDNDEVAVQHWSRFLCASRESAEILAEDQHMGQALARLLSDLDMDVATAWRTNKDVNFPAMFALASSHWRIALQPTLAGYIWAWCENQVAAAMKLVPLGQTAGQRILSGLIESLPAWIERASNLADDEIGTLCPGLAIASAKHEIQYSRLFRS